MNLKTYSVEAQKDTPRVHFDPINCEFLIEGKSYPEDALTFYKPVLDWLDSCFKDIKKSGHFTFKLQYFNTASAKILVDILRKIKPLTDKGIKFKVDWYYDAYDEDMKFAATQLSEITGVELNILEEAE